MTGLLRSLFIGAFIIFGFIEHGTSAANNTNVTLQGYYEVTSSTLDAVPLNLTDLSVINNGSKIVIIVPPAEQFNDDIYKKLETAYKNVGNYTIIKMNYQNIGNDTKSNKKKMEAAGNQLAMFIAALQNKGVNESNIHLIANGEAARVASYAAKLIPSKTFKKIGRYTALNPPGKSLWTKIKSIFVDEDIVKPTDAEVVVTLRTMNGYSSTGAIDFYANKGKEQPGCYKEVDCYSRRGVEIMAESVQSKNFHAQKCTHGFFKGWSCEKAKSVVFGENMSEGVKNGTYVFYTNSVPPYALG